MMNFFFLTNLISLFFMLSLYLLLNNIFCSTCLILDFELFNAPLFSFNFILLLDYFSLLFLWTVLLISSSVFTFSSSYMSSDKFYMRFHYLLFSFVLSMLMLILSPNLISVLLGWDGLGISSYLLVIYYSSPKSFNAGMVTFASNRVGDALIIISLSYLVYLVKLNMFLLFYVVKLPLNWAVVIIVVATFTKSAQVPFSAWLPAAMAAPTPVSALVHSSTLVTAGVYMLFRFDSLLFYLSLNSVILMLGTLTMFMASMSAFFEMDMKKMVALSTLSQLGVMMAALGAGFSVLGFLHLLAHAFFKALLFISAGNLIHSAEGYQDLRVMGGSSEALPFTKSIIMGCSMSLCGLPFMSAFYSKEMIIESLLTYNLSFMSYFIMMLGILMTMFYSIRFIMISVGGVSRQRSLFNKSDTDLLINLSMMFLFFPAVMGGGLVSSCMKFKLLFMVGEELKLMTLLLLIAGLIYFFKFYQLGLPVGGPLLWSMGSLWGLPYISARMPMSLFMNWGDFLHKLVDFSWAYFIFSNLYSYAAPLSFNKLLFQNMLFMRMFSNMLIFILAFFLFIY